VTLVPATMEHAREVAASMRPEDAAEVGAAGGYTPLGAILASMDESDVSVAFFFSDGSLGGIFGERVTGDPLDPICIPWLLTTSAVERNALEFFRASRRVVEDMNKRYRFLVQNVDARYERAVLWATAIGFRALPPEPFGKAGLPFYPIVRSHHV
jgi:hypothetical protein